MSEFLTPEQRLIVDRISKEPYQWLWKMIPDLPQESVFKLIDQLKSFWKVCAANGIAAGIVFDFASNRQAIGALTLKEPDQLFEDAMLDQNRVSYLVDLDGTVRGREVFPGDLDYQQVQTISHELQCAAAWLGSDFKLYIEGQPWPALDRMAVLREIKGRKGGALLDPAKYDELLDYHFANWLRGERRSTYWAVKSKLKLMPTPERIFQTSLWTFINDHVDCIFADKEAVVPGSGRIDVRVFTPDFSVYIYEIKCVDNSKGPANGLEWAKSGAYQTQEYLDQNLSVRDEYTIARGIYVLYDACDPPLTPLDFSDVAQVCPRFDSRQFRLVEPTPSAKGRASAKAKLGVKEKKGK